MAKGNRLITAGSRVRLRLAADDRLVAFVRRGDHNAFEALYQRHAGELLAFCVYVLGSRQDAEDAVQATFASAYRALLARAQPVALRPWLFTIARNDCLSILRKRRPTVELNGEPALRGDPLRELELREEVQHVLEGVLGLPERQRVALVLAELHGLSQLEIGAVLGVRPEQVKAYVYQARSHLISEKRARDADCGEIREELATAHGAGLLKGRLRRHVHACEGCRAYADGLSHQRRQLGAMGRQLGALLPAGPTLALKYRSLEYALGIHSVEAAKYAGGTAGGGSLAGVAAELAGGGANGLLAKTAAGVACLGASACVGVSVIGAWPSAEGGHAGGAPASAPGGSRLIASAGPVSASGSSSVNPARSGRVAPGQARAPGSEQSGSSERTRDGALRRRSGREPANPGVTGRQAAERSRVRQGGNGAERQRKSEQRLRKGGEERRHKGEGRRLRAEERRRMAAARRPTRKSPEQRLGELEERRRMKGSRPPRKLREGSQREGGRRHPAGE